MVNTAGIIKFFNLLQFIKISQIGIAYLFMILDNFNNKNNSYKPEYEDV